MLNSLRTRMVLIFVSLTILPLIIVGASVALRGYDTLQRQSVTFQSELAARTAIRLEAFFNERQNELYTLTDVYGLDSFSPAQQRDILLTLLSKQQAYYQLAIVGTDGQEAIRITRGEVITPTDFANRTDDPVFQTALESGSVAFSPVYFNETARDRLITLALPVQDLITGGVGYVLMAEVRFQNIGDAVLRDLNLGDDEDVFIIAQDGTILAHRNPSLVIRGQQFTLPASDGLATGLSNPNAILATNKVSLANQELTVVAETSFVNATALANDLLTIATLITVVTLVVSILVVAFAANRLVRPIIEMSRVAKAVEKGNLSARANESGKGEIAALGYSFNQMTGKLQQTLDNLRANEARLAATIQALPDMLFSINANGDLVDYHTKEVGGVAVAEDRFDGRSVGDIMPAEQAAVLMEKIQAALKTGELQTYEYRLQTPDVTLEFETRIVKANDESVVAIARDITEQKQRAQERERLIKDLQAAKRLAEENSRLKSEFLSTMSHELRTPLNAIEGFTSVVLKRIGGADFNAKTEEYLNRVHSNSRRLLQLINDFLDLSRVEAGRLELANQPFNPTRLAQRWQDEISVLAEKKGLSFTNSVDPAIPEMLYGDEEAISKVAINLLSNAIKFTEVGGIDLKLNCRDSVWEITVTDTGIGIPPHAREFIFEEFRQVDQSSKRKYGGTGLGLAIVHKYTRSMGGSVGVKSELGQGSIFTVTLPLKTTP